MAKIKCSKFNGQAPKGIKIKSICGESYLNNYKKRLQRHTEIAHQNHKARIKAKNIILLEKAKQEKD